MKKLLLSVLATVSISAMYHSQCQQDKYLNEVIFKNKKNGVFIDIGAHDGKTFSNSLFFEDELGWSGLCIEANPDVFKYLKKLRSAECINCCIVPVKEKDLHFLKIQGYPDMLSGIYEFYDPRHLQRIQNELNNMGGTFELIKLPVDTLNDILESKSIYEIDFLSLDIEGGELEILKNLDYSKFDIKVIVVENNFNDETFEVIMKKNGYNLVKNLEQDQVFIKKDFVY